MKVFISWSGDESRAVATALYTFIPAVVQAAEPWMSSEDIAAGGHWHREISDRLSEHDLGVVCVTPANVAAPWLNYEAGALAKSVSRASVVPFLHGVTHASLANSPLGQLQACRSDVRDEVFKMMETINDAAGNQALAPDRLARAFDHEWADLQDALGQIAPVDNGTPAPSSPGTDELLELLLQRMSSQEAVMSDLHAAVGLLANAAIQPTSPRSSSWGWGGPFSSGDWVDHPSFGRGVVLERRANGKHGAELTVRFEQRGTKHLAEEWAPLRPARDPADFDEEPPDSDPEADYDPETDD